MAARSLVHSKTDTRTRRKERRPAPTRVSRSVSHTRNPSSSPSLRSTDKTPTKADFVIGKQTPAMEQQPAGLFSRRPLSDATFSSGWGSDD